MKIESKFCPSCGLPSPDQPSWLNWLAGFVLFAGVFAIISDEMIAWIATVVAVMVVGVALIYFDRRQRVHLNCIGSKWWRK